MAIDIAADLATIVSATGDLPTVTGTYAQGSNTKASARAVRHRRRGGPGPGSSIDREEARLVLVASFFASGFSSSSPVYPAAGDTFTVSGERAWTVERVEPLGLGAGYALDVARRTGRGGGP